MSSGDPSWPFRGDGQEKNAEKASPEREASRWHSRIRGSPRRVGYGRRRADYDTRTTLTAKVVAGIVFLVNFLYLVGDALLTQQHC